jgi:hypothetical protein
MVASQFFSSFTMVHKNLHARSVSYNSVTKVLDLKAYLFELTRHVTPHLISTRFFPLFCPFLLKDVAPPCQFMWQDDLVQVAHFIRFSLGRVYNALNTVDISSALLAGTISWNVSLSLWCLLSEL